MKKEIEILRKKIIDAKPNEKIELPGHLYYKEVMFDEEFEMRGFDNDKRVLVGYCWSAYDKNEISSFPMRTSEIVKIFKTLLGAKRNFIKKHLLSEWIVEGWDK